MNLLEIGKMDPLRRLRATGFVQRDSMGSIVTGIRRTSVRKNFPGGFNDARQADFSPLSGSGLHLVGGTGCRRMQELDASGTDERSFFITAGGRTCTSTNEPACRSSCSRSCSITGSCGNTRSGASTCSGSRT